MISQGSQGTPAKDQKPPHATGRRELLLISRLTLLKLHLPTSSLCTVTHFKLSAEQVPSVAQ